MEGKGKWGLGEVGKRWAGTLTPSTTQASDITADFGSRRKSLAPIKGVMSLVLTKCLACTRHPAPNLRHLSSLKT